jgi:trimeric autotransporter adhesin
MAYQPKNRKFLAGTITAAVVASAIAPAASAAEVKFTDLAGLDAETNTAIESLVGLEVIKGYPDGTFKPNQTINRGQAAEMTVKALKLDTPAPTGKVFEDLSDKSYYAKFAEALAKAGLIPATGKFGAGTDMTREAMAVALVSGLGLKATDKAVDVKDLETASPEARDAIKILAQHDVTKLLDGKFNPKDAVKRSQFALFFFRGVEAAGLNQTAVTAEVKVVDVNKIEVKFNKAVDTTKVTAALKIGAASLYTTSTFSEDKKSVVLTAPSAIATGSYNVVISGIAAADVVKPITVEAATPKAIDVTNTEAYLKDGAVVTFSVKNQYATDMGVKANNADLVVTAYNVTQSKAVEVVKTSSTKSELGLNLTTGTAKVGDEVRVILTYKGVTVTKVLKVVADAANADITLGTVAPLKDKTRITTGETGLELPYVLKDQYGNDKKITNLATSGVTFVSSDNTVVNPATSFSVDATTGKITFTAGAAGTATITAIINATGKVAQTTVTVNGTSALKTVVISSPTALISAGQTVNLDLAGTDQFGGAVTDFSGVAVTDNHDNVTASIVNGKLKVVTSGTAAGTATITLKKASDATVTYGTITITFEKVAEPTVLVSVDTVSTLEVGATTTVKLSDIKVKDQYGRDFTLTDASQVTVKAVDDDFTGVKQDATNKLKFDAATAPGTEAVSFTLANGATKTVTFATVATSSVTSYSINTVGTLFAQGTSTTLGAYDVTLGLAGKLADGTAVKLATSKVTHATSNNEAVAVVSVDATTKAVTVKGLTKGSSLVTLYAGATKLAEVTVNVDNATAVASSVEFEEAAYTISGTETLDLLTELTVKDQYGVAYAKNGFFASSDTSIATVSSTGVVSKPVGSTKTGNVTITYMTTNGIVKTVTVTVN